MLKQKTETLFLIIVPIIVLLIFLNKSFILEMTHYFPECVFLWKHKKCHMLVERRYPKVYTE